MFTVIDQLLPISWTGDG